VPRIAGPRHDLTDFESAADHVALQYPKTIRWLRDQAPDAATFTGRLFKRMERVEREKRTVLE
jgi:hypothetical protein